MGRGQIKKLKRLIIPCLGFLIIIGIFYKTHVNIHLAEQSLCRNYQYSKGKIVDVALGGRSADYSKFEYRIKEERYIGEYFPKTREIGKILNMILTYDWPMIYDSTDYENATLLLQKSDYEKFGLPYTGGRIVDFEKMEIVDSIQTIPILLKTN